MVHRFYNSKQPGVPESVNWGESLGVWALGVCCDVEPAVTYTEHKGPIYVLIYYILKVSYFTAYC